ncbi:UbiA family prenyltransferase [Algoriphagus namhaensis]
MISKSSIKHLRIPFSVFLLPIFLFALALSPNLDPTRLLLVFLSLHLFLYPSSNGYNSYFDKDEKSIGGLKNPPKVTKDLYWLAQSFFLIALLLGWMVSFTYACFLAVYGLVSMAYSHPSIRLKKYGWLSWFITGLFQGYVTFSMAYIGLSDLNWTVMIQSHVLLPGLCTSLMLWGSYPLTQVYQHEEDSLRGDRTISIKLGVLGTFLFSSLFFLGTSIGFAYFFYQKGQEPIIWVYLASMAPVIIFFFVWFSFVKKDRGYANFTWAMAMTWISALALNGFFLYYFFENTQILQVINQV